MGLVSGDGASVLSTLLATSFGLFTHVLFVSVCPWHMCFYTGWYILCCFDAEDAMVALLKTLSPLQITEVEDIHKRSHR